MQEPVVNIKNLTKYYRDIIGVKKISFQVHSGEIFGFLGPNGSGKTTSIRLMLDLLRPNAGIIELFGQDIAEFSFEIHQRCGYLPGNFTAYGNMKGNEFLHFCSGLRKTKEKPEYNLLNRFELSKNTLNQKIKFLSHGTMQKLGIIQAFMHNPELLILDEPTIGLDPLMQEVFYDLVRENQARGCTVFLSSHNLSEVEKICHRMALIKNGEIVKVESIENLRQQLSRKLIITLTEQIENIDLPNAYLIQQNGLRYEYLVTENIGEVFRSLANWPIADIVFPEPNLEEIFINLYKEGSND